MSKKPYTISIMGVDGVGKSTQIKLLIKALEKEGFTVGHIRFSSDELRDEVEYHLDKIKRNNQTLIHVATALDISTKVPKLEEEYRKRDIIIYERYKWCRLAVAELYQCSEMELLKQIYSKFKNLDLYLFLDAPIEKCIRNIDKRGEDIESYDDLYEFRELYKSYKEFESFHIISSNRSILEIHNNIKNIVLESMR